MIELRPLPPAEAVEYFRQKGFAIGFDYRDVWQQQHQAAFTVAKAMQLDLLQDIRAEVERALAEGTTLQDFARRLTPTLQDKGWWGRRPMRDPLTGETRDVQLGSPRRLKTIYDTNLRTAQAEGQWQRIQAQKAAFPLLQYDGANSEHPRLQHRAWDGMVLPVDDPFWQAHLPVKEWGCKCRVIPLTRRQAERQGLTVSESPKVPTRPYVNARTGEVQQIPLGVHPAFHYPPGGRRASLNGHLVDKLEGAAEPLARASIADLLAGQAWADWYRQPAGRFPLAWLGPAPAERLGAKAQVLALSDDVLARQLREQPAITLEDYGLVQAVIDQGRRILENGRVVYVLEQGNQVLLVEAAAEGTGIGLRHFRRLTRAAARRDRQVRQWLQ